jgi:hypothetical protein
MKAEKKSVIKFDCQIEIYAELTFGSATKEHINIVNK